MQSSFFSLRTTYLPKSDQRYRYFRRQTFLRLLLCRKFGCRFSLPLMCQSAGSLPALARVAAVIMDQSSDDHRRGQGIFVSGVDGRCQSSHAALKRCVRAS